MNPYWTLDGPRSCTLYHGDCLEILRAMPADSVDLVFGSPPYEDARTYGIGFALKGQAWVDWMAKVVIESVRVCRGLVAFVVEGKTKNFQWSATPALLMADLHRAGIKLRKPPVFHRIGIPGSGGPDWIRNDTEWIVCSTKGKLPWSDNTAMGHPPIYPPGGPPSHRTTATRGSKNGDTRVQGAVYKPPSKANPGNVIRSTQSIDEVISLLREYTNETHGDPAKTMRALQRAILQETLCAWLVGITESIRSQKILQSAVHGGIEGDEIFHEKGDGQGALSSPNDGRDEDVRGMRHAEKTDSSPQRRKSNKQREIECSGSVQKVPQQPPQEVETKEVMSRVWSETSLVGIVRSALPQIQAAWRSAEEMLEQSLWYRSSCGDLIHCKVGGGLMGHPLAHENEAPFPESLAEFFVRSFCPPDGIALDPFVGSGTTIAVASRHGRQSIGIEVRDSQLDVCRKRIIHGVLFS